MGNVRSTSGHPQERTIRTGTAEHSVEQSEPNAGIAQLATRRNHRAAETAYGLCPHHLEQYADGHHHPNRPGLRLRSRPLQRAAVQTSHPAQGGRSVDTLHPVPQQGLCAKLLVVLPQIRRGSAGEAPHAMDSKRTPLPLRRTEKSGNPAFDRKKLIFLIHHRVHRVTRSSFKFFSYNVIQSICHSDDRREEESREHIGMENISGCTRDPSLHSVPFWMTKTGKKNKTL